MAAPHGCHPAGIGESCSSPLGPHSGGALPLRWSAGVVLGTNRRSILRHLPSSPSSAIAVGEGTPPPEKVRRSPSWRVLVGEFTCRCLARHAPRVELRGP